MITNDSDARNLSGADMPRRGESLLPHAARAWQVSWIHRLPVLYGIIPRL